VAKSVRWTVIDLERIPEDGKLREIIDGELFVSTQPQTDHQVTCLNVSFALKSWNDPSGLGVVIPSPGVIFSPEDAVAPDVTWISHSRLAGQQDRAGHLRVAPELVVEVVSPGPDNERRDRTAKLALYGRRGVSEYWMLDWRQRQVEVYRRTGDVLTFSKVLAEVDATESPILPGFHCPVRQFFAGVPVVAVGDPT
jgi:Uma2 family endonuclease